MARTVKNIVEDVFGVPRTNALWTGNYYPVLPFATQAFDIGGMLPSVLYLARWGHRRGKGNFAATFKPDADGKRLGPSISDVVSVLLTRPEPPFMGFDEAPGNAVLGDLLLAWCLENRRHAEGHAEPVQRIFPTHFLASWIDLPDDFSNLRGVPEIITSLLADQKNGEYLKAGERVGPYPVGVKHDENLLLQLFGRHVQIRGQYAHDLSADEFNEQAASDIGVDELLAVRLSQTCGRAPYKAKGKGESEQIPNRRPLARAAGDSLREDLGTFIELYGKSIPRQALLQMLEAGIALGLSNILLSTAALLAHWEQYGKLPDIAKPWPLLVDASQGQDKALRDMSEASMTECIRRYERFSVQLMMLRLLDDRVSSDRKLRDQLPPKSPCAGEFIELLGRIYIEDHPRADAIHDALDEDCARLADGMEAAGEAPELVQRLRRSGTNAALRLAEVLCELMGDKLLRDNYKKALDSALFTDRPNGLAVKRRVRRTESGVARAIDLRSINLSAPLLDFLVHRHLGAAHGKSQRKALSLQGFLALLREQYGLYVDREPPGQPVPQELLLRNKAALERRLRDMGLLMGVNDAESMKQLKSRYNGGTHHAA